ASRLAGVGARKDEGDKVPLEIDPLLRLSEAKLTSLSQQLAYRGIREIKMGSYTQRTRTADNVIRAINNIEVFFSETPTEPQIWRSLRHHDIRREVRYFLWMALHDGYMVGTNWLHPGYSQEMQDRSECRHCGVTETMDHILANYAAPGQELVWNLARNLWVKRNELWPRPSLGAVLSCARAP
ncbi:hypothetical protein WOLCODRAFT_53697, partial [Wolfiporia cocos MD-104 SS10]